MNRMKLLRILAHAAQITGRWNPPFRVYDMRRDQRFSAKTRDEARAIKRRIVEEGGGGSCWIEQLMPPEFGVRTYRVVR